MHASRSFPAAGWLGGTVNLAVGRGWQVLAIRPSTKLEATLSEVEGARLAYNPMTMLSGALVVVSAALITWLVSRFMWWACRRSAMWSMAAGAILAVLALGGAVVIAWMLTRAWYGR